MEPNLTSEEDPSKRRIRSFVRRDGRITKGQHDALDLLWPKYGVEYSNSLLNFSDLFQRNQPITLEIGFGNGGSLAEMAAAQSDQDFIGIEVYRSGVGQLLQRIERDKLTNLRIINADAIEVLTHMIAPDSLQTVQLFFPDPWPKKRHHKRRIVSESFLNLITSRLKKGGCFHMATDWENYALTALEELNDYSRLKNMAADCAFLERPAHRPVTKFERRGQRLNHGVWDLMFECR